MSSNAERQRRRRARLAAGKRVVSVAVDAALLELALEKTRDLLPSRADDREELERALSALVERTCTEVLRE